MTQFITRAMGGLTRSGQGAVRRPSDLLRALLVVFASMDVAAIVSLLFIGDRGPVGLAITFLALPLLALCEALRRRGRVALGSRVIITVVWLLSTLGVMFTGGNGAELSGMFAVLIVAAGLLLGRRDALGFGVLFAATVTALVIASQAQLDLAILADLQQPTLGGRWLLSVTALALATATIVYATRLLERADEQMRYAADLSEHFSEAVISTDLDYTIRTWSRGAQEMYGWRPEEAVGKSMRDVVPPTFEGEGAREASIRALREHGHWSGEVVQHDRGGRPIDIRSSVTFIRNKAGEPTGIVAVNRDITRRKEAERALRKETELTQAIIDSLPGMFFMFDREGGLVRWNSERERFLGYDPDEIATMGVGPTIAPEDRQAVAQCIAQVWEEGIGSSEHRVVTKAGERIPVHARGRRVDFEGEDYIVGMSIDMRDRVAMEQALRASESRYREFVTNSTEAMARLEFEESIDVGLPVEAQVDALIDGAYLAECNARFATMYGLGSAEKAVGTRLAELLRPTAEEGRSYLLDFVNNGYSQVVDDVHATDEHGLERVFRSSVRGTVEDGKLHRIWAIRSDLTEQRLAESALQRSEARWRSYIDQATDFIIALDTEGRFTSVNPAGCAALGYAEAELIGRSPLDITAPEDRQRAANVLGRMLRGDEGESMELDVVTRDDERLTLEVTGRPFVSEGRVMGTFHIARDITLRREIELALRISEQRFRTLVEQSPFSMVVHGAEGRTVMANQAAAELWGLTPEQIAFMIANYNVLEDEAIEAQGVASYVRRAYAGEAVAIPAKPMPRRSPEGEILEGPGRLIRGFAYPIKDVHGGVREVVILHEDVTERRRAEEVLRQVEKMESLGLLSGGLAHDFNNLLTAVLGHASLARDKLDEADDAHVHLRRIVDAAERASSLTEQLLAYSGRGRFHVRPIDLNRLIEAHLPLLEVAVPSSVRLETDLAPLLPAVEADEAQLQQLVMNLVINACEAASEGECWVRITTDQIHLAEGAPTEQTRAGRPLPPGDYLRLSVRDGGPGIDEETRRRIFDPFFTTKDDGHGLGLAAVLGIVRGHEGGLRLESVPGHGTSFEVLLPASDAEVEPEPEPLKVARSNAPAGVVLVIDDEASVRNVVAAILEDDGIPTLEAEDGESGLAVLASAGDRVRVILLDLTMPGISGEETCRRIRELQPDVPVIATSGYSDLELDQRLAALGVVDFLKKPYPYERLTALVRQHLADGAGEGDR